MNENQIKPMKMKWYKFLIYFSLFASAIANILYGIFFVSKVITYSDESLSNILYRLYPSLKMIDLIYGIGCILIAIFTFYTRFQLSSRRTHGPKMLTYFYVACMTISVYSIGAYIVIMGLEQLNTQLLVVFVGSVQIISSIIMILINKKYFKKRADIFIN